MYGEVAKLYEKHGDVQDFGAYASDILKRGLAPEGLSSLDPDSHLLASIGAIRPRSEHNIDTWTWWKQRMADPNADTTMRVFDTLGILAREAASRIARATGRPEQETLMAQGLDAWIKGDVNKYSNEDTGLINVSQAWKDR
jgi:hypothetical protein